MRTDKALFRQGSVFDSWRVRHSWCDSTAPPPHLGTETPGQHKFSLGGPAQFIPSLNAIASSQDLQWLLSPEELERRRVRRERNKMAAAKCRNRRRELTDTLQNETDQLESNKAGLQKEIAGLEKQKEKLELVLEAHMPICKIQSSDSDSDQGPGGSAGGRGIKTEPKDSAVTGPSCRKRLAKLKMSLPAAAAAAPSPPEPESLHTPTLVSTPSLTPFTASMIFTYPSAPLDSQPHSSSSSLVTAHSLQKPQPCGVAHRRSSSSGDQSDHSLNSPTLLTL
ncbi:hypothetical protein AAFF_G00291290 [Aldrovandia affinis]|uniref:BZIP domain-containing protein n=1 Tax=Aldrovandia affinis TaxID=143900 RepID=A0AAD7W1Z0_9TELE|nr:hypothetical protein AAFF_G00291290 [Aldrovandia affinis]